MHLKIRHSRRLLTPVLALALLVAHGANCVAQVPSSESSAAAIDVVVEMTGRVERIDASKHLVTLRGPRGNLAEVEVDPATGDVSKLKVGDMIHVAYKGAVLVSAEKVSSKGIRSRVESDVTVPASGGTAASARHIKVVATVQKVDLKKRQVTLRGPMHTVTLQVASDVPLEHLKVGDDIRAEYVGAVAVRVTRPGANVQ